MEKQMEKHSPLLYKLQLNMDHWLYQYIQNKPPLKLRPYQEE